MFFSLDCGAGAGPDVEPPRVPVAVDAVVVGGTAVVASVVPFDTDAADDAAVVVAPNGLDVAVEDGAAVVVAPKIFGVGAEDGVAVVAPNRLEVGAEVAAAVVVGAAETLRPVGAAVFGAAPAVVVATLEVFPNPAKRFGVGAEAAEGATGTEGTLVAGAKLNGELAVGAAVEVAGN